MLMRQYFYGLASFIPALLTWTAIFIATLTRQNPELLTHQDVVRPPYVLPRPTKHQLPSHASLKSWGPNPGKRYDKADIAALEKRAVDIFYHGYDNYMKYAFPHDDLKPLTKSYTDSLGDLGGQGSPYHGRDYKGVALTLIDALSTLAVLGNVSEFQKNVAWLSDNLSFDVDVQVNVFEANIRLLGGLLSSHLLASNTDHEPNLTPRGYKGELLWLANDLGLRLLPAFQDSPTGCPYPWVNLRHGMDESSKRVTETNVAACGSLILEMGTLSRLTGNPIFEDYSLKAIHALMERRSVMDLFGSTINMMNMQWTNLNGGIGASSDSFYEYLLKAYILFGIDELWEYFKKVYVAALSHYKVDSWYYDATWMGQPTFIQFASLQSFWPGFGW